MAATVIYMAFTDATWSSKGILRVPGNDGLYVSGGALYDYAATTTRRGTVRIMEGGGIGVGYNNGAIYVNVDGTTTYVDDDGHLCAAAGDSGPHWEVRRDATGTNRLAIVIPEEE